MKKSSFRFSIWILVGGMFLVATTLTGQTMVEVEAFRVEVEKIFERRKISCLNPSLEDYISIWDERAIRIEPDQPPIFGISSIKNKQRRTFQNWSFLEIDTNIEEVNLAGDWGWSHSTYWLQMKSKTSGGWLINKGTLLTIFKKQADGSWRIYCDTMMPAPE